jgi:hypothetical protein
MALFASKRNLCPIGVGMSLWAFIAMMGWTLSASAQQVTVPASWVSAPGLPTGSISGTATDAEHDIIPGATVMLDGPGGGSPRTVVTDQNGAFNFTNLNPGGPYYVTIKAHGFVPWTSPAVDLKPSQMVFLSGVNVQLSGGATSITVSASPAKVAVEQVHLEEKQRVLGIVPNFYVVYDHDAAPLTTRLKFALALRTEVDPVIVLGAAFLSGMDQAGGTPDYDEGVEGYAKRLGANYTTGFVDIMTGGAILPSLLHQDPRYFYQGTGTTRSRIFHAISSPFICKGDNGRWQPNISSVGGDLTAGAVSEAYYPSTNRGAALVFENALITTAGRMVNGVVQEFVLRRFTTGSAAANQ